MVEKKRITLPEHITELVSDSGEGAQKASVAFGKASALMGNGLWTVEVIPAEIQPPPHTVGATSGNRIRMGNRPMTNTGDRADCVVAFNEMALLGRMQTGMLKNDVLVLIDSLWADHPIHAKSYKEVLDEVRARGGTVVEVPFETETTKVLEDPKRGKNMFALGVWSRLYMRDLQLVKDCVTELFGKKGKKVLEPNLQLVQMGWDWGEENLPIEFEILTMEDKRPMIAMNGNTAIALGAVAAGFELCSMYPITPATSASHALADFFEDFGGFVHQAEDEIAAIGVAVGASYAGRTALTITSGPGMALKTEFQGLAVMIEVPLVIVNVQRGGPSTGLPTKIEQSDLLHALYAAPGDAPKIVLAPASIEDCFHVMITARKLAEEFRSVVIVLTDANLATGQQLFDRPQLSTESLPPPLDFSPVAPEDKDPYAWDPVTGLSKRFIPGQPGGESVVTGLNHGRKGGVTHDEESNEQGHAMRSRKLATLFSALKPPVPYGDDEGDLLLVCWGSTKGAIEEAVDRMRGQGASVSSLFLAFLSPLQPGLKAIFSRYRKVMTVELNYSDKKTDPLITPENRRYSQLATVLRAATLVDVDCWSRVPGRPLMPSEICEVIAQELAPETVSA
ncbi:MAG: 2-oxoacid:acceptor oxidoreductase subunit alpha [Candidatus Delongbacteria bacterium]|nr:2-oxoacid:acceptor oxidoreductase subunit alpha [Candidatus Delongbacteria bacterium]